MKIEIDDEYCSILMDGIDCLIKNFDQYGYKIEDIPKIASLGIAFKANIKRAIKEIDDPEAKYNKEHPEMVRGPNPGEKMVLGKGYVKDKPDEK